jgi:hypothetical protein
MIKVTQIATQCRANLKPVPIIAAIMLLSIGCNIGLLAASFNKAERIAKINAEPIVREITAKIAKQALGEEESKKALREELAVIEATMKEFASKKNIVIFPTQALVEGGIDITDEFSAWSKKERE